MQIEAWISRGWLTAKEVAAGKLKRVIITGEDFCDFCKQHTKDVVGNRLTKERLDFVYRFAFPPGHAELLPVRERKQERNAHKARMAEEEIDENPPRFAPKSVVDEDDSCDRTG